MATPDPNYSHAVYLGEGHDNLLSTQGGACPTGLCHSRASHCGRCGACSGYQGHYFAHCSVTETERAFHFCCPGDCELEPDTAAALDRAHNHGQRST